MLMRGFALSPALACAVAGALALGACEPPRTPEPAATATSGPVADAAAPNPFAAPEARASEGIAGTTDETPAPSVVIQHAVVLTAAGQRFDPGYVLLEKGRIAAV